MSDSGPTGSNDDPFQGIPFFGDLARMFQQQGPVSWDAARQLAYNLATGGTSEDNVDPSTRLAIEQLARVADLQVAHVTGLATSGGTLRVEPVNRTQWVARSEAVYRPLVEQLAGSLARPPQPDPEAEASGDPFAALLPQMLSMLSPMLIGMTAGSLLGHLSRRSFGQYELPIPRDGDDLLLVVPNLDDFAAEWELPVDELRLWVCVHEIAHHAVLRIPHVRDRLQAMMREYAAGFQPDPNALEERLGQIELQGSGPDALAALQQTLGDPEALLGAMRSQAQIELLPRLEALVVIVVGYVDHVMDSIGASLIPSFARITEAMRRRRVEADPSDRFVERLLGLSLSQDDYDRGRAFVDGVVERAGADGLARLWHSERELPTPAEVDAPGLWLARIDLPED